MTDMQELFCQEYLVDLNMTQAAMRAGYSEISARNEGSRLMKNDVIRARIRELMDARSKDILVDQAFVVNNLIEIANRCQQAVPVMEWDYVTKSMIHKGAADNNPMYEFDSNGANRAVELLGKHLAMFTDKSQIDIPDGLSVIIKGAKFATQETPDNTNNA